MNGCLIGLDKWIFCLNLKDRIKHWDFIVVFYCWVKTIQENKSCPNNNEGAKKLTIEKLESLRKDDFSNHVTHAHSLSYDHIDSKYDWDIYSWTLKSWDLTLLYIACPIFFNKFNQIWWWVKSIVFMSLFW